METLGTESYGRAENRTRYGARYTRACAQPDFPPVFTFFLFVSCLHVMLTSFVVSTPHTLMCEHENIIFLGHQ